MSNGGRVLFVGTKAAAAERIADSAKRCGQYYVNHRWLGGMITNWQTISASIKRLRELDDRLKGDVRKSQEPALTTEDIERMIFEGPTAQLRVRVGDRELRVDVGGGRRLTLADSGRRVRLGFDDLTVIPTGNDLPVDAVGTAGTETA